MITRLNMLALTSAAILLSLTWTDNAQAQQRQTEMPDPATDRASCTDIDWHRNLVQDYPWVGDACHETVMVNGQKWARFEAEFQELTRDGTVISDFRDERGRSLGRVNLEPDSDQRVLLDGRPTRFSDLRRGQVLNFYAPEGVYALTTEPGAPADQQVQFAEPRGEPRQPSQSDRQLARAERTTGDRRERLPATAGPLPMIALAGMFSLLGGITLTTRRRLAGKNS